MLLSDFRILKHCGSSDKNSLHFVERELEFDLQILAGLGAHAVASPHWPLSGTWV